MTLSPLLRLPSELRIRIYEYILTFSGPIKLRQVVSGSENTTLLRVNRQIHDEALSVLFDVNTVAITRNDLCKKTDQSLKSPVRGEHVRHLLVSNFGESIACNFLLDRCEVCEHHGKGFLDAFREMPQLKTVIVDYRYQLAKFRRFGEALASVDSNIQLSCTAVGRYHLCCAGLEHVEFTFQHLALARIWPALIALLHSVPSESEEERVLDALRETDSDLPDKLWLLICAKQCDLLATFSAEIADTWVEPAGGLHVHAATKPEEFHAFNQALQAFINRETASQCRRYLKSVRELQAV